jgi:hypothetical protein
MRLGLFKQGMDPQAAMAKLLGFLVLQGFMPKAEGAKDGGAPLPDAQQLSEAIKQLQAKDGLPQTGKLDDKTLKTLERFKQAAPSAERPAERQSASPEKQATARLATSFRDQSLAAWIKNKASDLLPKAPVQTQLPVTTAQQPQQAQPKPTVLDASAQQLAQQQAQLKQLAEQPPQTQQTQAQTVHKEVEARTAQQDGRLTREAGDGKPPPPEVNAAQQKGQGKEGGPLGKKGEKKGLGTGKHGDKVGGSTDDEEGGHRGDADQPYAFEDGRGNQATGDEDEEDERRGAALVDDGSGADEGAYEIPSVYKQVRDALDRLEREPETEANRPMTYRCDFVIYKPGVYQTRTMASQLLNLKVVNAMAYDDVWKKVIEQVNARLRVFEPDSPQLSEAIVQSALQRARARALAP